MQRSQAGIDQDIRADIIEAARGGACSALDRLIEAAWPHAYRIALSVLRDGESAEEIAQESCAIVYRRIGDLRSTSAFKVWFCRIVMRRAVALAKDRRRCDDRSCDGVMTSESFDADQRIDVRAAIAALSPEQRAAIVLRYYAGMNSREIGSILGMPDGSVRFHLLRGKRILEKALSEYGGVASGLMEGVEGVR